MKRLLLILALLAPLSASAAYHPEDSYIKGSLCLGFDCANNAGGFGFDTLVIKENNLRVLFSDTSGSASFPGRDWRLVINDTANGGTNYFGVEDVDAGRRIFQLTAGSPANSLVLDAQGDLGLGTAAAVTEIHSKDGDTPTLRLEQDGTSGFTPQTWDVGGNESNFFIRDATGGSNLVFRIRPGAPVSGIDMSADGVGFNNSSPQLNLHVKGSDTPGLRLEQTTKSLGLQTWDVAANEVNFMVRDVTNGNALPLRIRPGAPSNTLVLDTDGDIGLGTSSPQGALHVRSSAGYGVSDFSRGQLVLQNTSGSDTTMVNIRNAGAVVSLFQNTESGVSWIEAFREDAETGVDAWSLRVDGSPAAITVFGDGNVTIAGTLEQGSSRAIKHLVAPVDTEGVLQRLMQLAINTWSYRADHTQAAHMGPMAEDFYRQFSLGRDAQHLASSDAAGVALAALQALHRKVEALERRNRALEARLSTIERTRVQEVVR